jgi:hypothetical protein
VIPSNATTPEISEAIAKIPGNKIAVVIDDTGSMNDNRRKTAELYLAAINSQGKEIAGVFLYADGQVRKYEGGGVREIQFQTDGSRENTFQALQEAAKLSPDAIVLVTDEEGDDWDWSKTGNLPPVIAHCLPDQGQCECRPTLMQVAEDSKGQYIEEQL